MDCRIVTVERQLTAVIKAKVPFPEIASAQRSARAAITAALPSQPLLLAMNPARPFAVATLASPTARFRSDQRGACHDDEIAVAALLPPRRIQHDARRHGAAAASVGLAAGRVGMRP